MSILPPSQFNLFISGLCPGCGADVYIAPNPASGDVLLCHSCSALLQIVEPNPIVFIRLSESEYLHCEEISVEGYAEDDVEDVEFDERDANHIDDENDPTENEENSDEDRYGFF